jgi:Zn-dependent peptidase ImmA (M78 family)
MEQKLKALATEFRNQFGYNSTEPINYLSLLQRLDVLTVFKPLNDDFSGLSYKDGENRFMMVNSTQSVGRQNFTIVHELYHLYYDKNFIPHKCKTGIFPRKNQNEFWADIFASHLLLPTDGIARMIPDDEYDKDSIRLGTLLKIEQTYRSSRAALLAQLGKMGLASKAYKEEYSTGVKSSALHYGYSTDLYEPSAETKVVGAYGNLANRLYEEDKISEGHYRELLMAIGVDINEIREDEED